MLIFILVIIIFIYFPVEVAYTDNEDVAVHEEEIITIPLDNIKNEIMIEISMEIEEDVLYSEDDLFCLAAVIYNEAGGDTCTDEQRVLVGNVVINRMYDERFPNNIREVIEQEGQYAGMQNGVRFASRAKYDVEQEAVQRAYDTAKRVLKGEMIAPKNVVWQSEFPQGEGVWRKIGNTYFCY